jgi:tetratricopeptide (TPR) repeat protein
MTNVSLRIYNREIESLIEGGRIEEAIAHCLHILKTFPMSVETYQLLGKAFLEVRRFAYAADIFQRVLMAVPDDFVAHVGMSIIRDDEGNLDDAIWHMERAFEIQPSNPAIHGELKRLFGRRDGIEPPKVRLTRDALANMYSQGELYNQAILEIRSVMAEDANRADLQVMLARAYYRAGQKVEAAEMSMTLLKKYPYCLDALRILVDILPGTDRAEDAQIYRQRIEQLDPYSAFVKDSVFRSDQVADSVVTLERLEYQPSGKPEAVQPDWASSLGIKMGTGPLPRAIPAKVPPAKPAPQPQQTEQGQPPVSFEPPAPAAPGAAQGEIAIPDWLRSDGWQEATSEAKESPSEFAEQPQPSEPIAQAEIPDWLQAMAPEGAAAQVEAPELDLNPLAAEEPAPAVTPFDEMPAEGEQAAGPKPPFEGIRAGAAYEEISGTQPKWMEGIEAEKEVSTPFAETEPAAPVFGEQKPPEPEPTTAVPGLPSEDQDEALAWLENLAAKQGARPEELLTRPEERLENPPEWVWQEAATGKPIEAAGIEPEAEKVLPSALVAESATTLQEPAEAASLPEMPEGGIAAPTLEEPIPSGLAPEPPATPFMEEATLNWLDNLTAEESARAEARLEASPEAGQEQGPAEALPASKEGDATAWLKDLEAFEMMEKTPPAAQSQPKPPAGEELPDWLKGVTQPTSAAELSKEEELPEWLRMSTGMPESLPVQTPALQEQDAVEEVGAAVPSADEDIPVAAVLTPTAPEEWLPAEKVEPLTPEPVSFAVEPAAESVQPAMKPIALESEEPAPPPTEPTAPALRVAEPAPAAGLEGALSRVPGQDKDAELLLDAQSTLKRGKLDEAMVGFAKLIKKGRLLDEVIHELREAVYTYPVDIILWQTLGDAYNRSNQLQDALDAYTKAEELLR